MNGNDWTQLQYEFIKVDASDSFPLGVKMVYRKYSQDEVILIEKSDEEGRLGFKVYNAEVRIHPEAIPPYSPAGSF